MHKSKGYLANDKDILGKKRIFAKNRCINNHECGIMDYDLNNTIEITYSVFGFEEAGETSFDMNVSENIYNKLQDALLEGEVLDDYYISNNMKGLHKKILKAIRSNMHEEGQNLNDGMIEERLFWGGIYEEYHANASHMEMHNSAIDEEIEYTIYL